MIQCASADVLGLIYTFTECAFVPNYHWVIVRCCLKPNLKKCWCIPPEQNAAFVAAMEDVLAVYSRPYNKAYPVVCMDEKPIQFFADFRKGFRSKKNGVSY